MHDSGYSSAWIIKHMLVQRDRHWSVEQMPSPPRKRRFSPIFVLRQSEVDIPKRLWTERFDLVVPRDDEAEGRKLTWPVGDDVLELLKPSLQRESLHACKRSANTQVEKYTSLDCIRLCYIEVDGVLCCVVDLPA